MTAHSRYKTSLTALYFGIGASLAVGATHAQFSTQFGEGFKQFPQDSCDPLLSGVLTERGYQNTDLDDLYQRAYNENVRQGCGFARVGEVSTSNQFVDSFPNPVAQQFPEPLVVTTAPLAVEDPFANIVVPEPIDLPDLDLSEEPTFAGSFNGLYGRLFGAYASSSGSSGARTFGSTTTFTDRATSGYGASATLGYAINYSGLFIFSNLRPEIQASYYQFNGDGFTTSAPTSVTYTQSNETLVGGFANLVSDIEFGLLPVTPYLGAGIGYGRRSIDYGHDSFQGSGLLYQAMIGGRYGVTERISLDLGYKYLNSFDINSGQGTLGTYTLGGRNHHIVEGGLTYKF